MIRKLIDSLMRDMQNMSIATRLGIGVYMILVLITGLAAFVLALMTPRPYEPLVSFVEHEVRPEKAEYCPGDTMRFAYHWEAQHTPAVVRIVTTFYDPAAERTVIPMKVNDINVYIITALDEKTMQERSVEIPDLPAGNYEHRRAIETNYAESSALIVPFRIPESCFP